MNERIKELADEAAKYSATMFLPTGENGDKLFIEKFAELIVQECIVTIQMGITRDGHQTEKYVRSMKHINDIKQHFGVEE
jgi:MoaA/NifB/PqqE/SkfB family radical SAM enzyme